MISVCSFYGCSKMSLHSPLSFQRLPFRNENMLKIWATVQLVHLHQYTYTFYMYDYCQPIKKRKYLCLEWGDTVNYYTVDTKKVLQCTLLYDKSAFTK